MVKNKCPYTPYTMTRSFLSCLTILVLSGSFCSRATAQDKASLGTNLQVITPAILAHYSMDDLNTIKVHDSVKYQSILYYYTQSFIVEVVDCSDCVPADLNTFDVSKYEAFRKKGERYVRVYDKYGFKLTLLAIDELTYRLPIHLVKD